MQMTTCLQPLLNKLSSAINNGDESWDYRNPHIARIAISVYPSIAFRKTNRHCELIKHCLRRTVSFNRCYSTRRKLTHVSQRLCPSANKTHGLWPSEAYRRIRLLNYVLRGYHKWKIIWETQNRLSQNANFDSEASRTFPRIRLRMILIGRNFAAMFKHPMQAAELLAWI